MDPPPVTRLTGAIRGTGREIAAQLGEPGDHVVGGCRDRAAMRAVDRTAAALT